MRLSKLFIALMIIMLPIGIAAKTVSLPFGNAKIIEDKGDALKIEKPYYEISLEVVDGKLKIGDPVLKADTVWYDKRKAMSLIDSIWNWQTVIDTGWQPCLGDEIRDYQEVDTSYLTKEFLQDSTTWQGR